MQRWLCLVGVSAPAWCASSLWAADGSLESFYGAWQGTTVEVEGETPLDVRPEDLNVAIRPDGDGFRVVWTAFQREPDGGYRRETADARFAPTARPGVYAFDEGQPSLLGRLFASPATGDPLEGETLLWARHDGPTLVVYSLGLTEDGGFDLDQYARTVTDGTMQVVHTRRDEDPPLLIVRGELEPGD